MKYFFTVIVSFSCALVAMEKTEISKVSDPEQKIPSSQSVFHEHCKDLTLLRLDKFWPEEFSTLNLDNNGIYDVEKSLELLVFSKKKQLGEEKVKELLGDAASKSHISVANINLSNNHICALPASFNTLENLRILDLNSNKFKQFPEIVCSLVWLKVLSFAYNNIEEIPSTIGNLTKLEQLALQSNKLKKLPSEIGNLAMLESLDIGDNSFEELLPKELFALKYLWPAVRNDLMEIQKGLLQAKTTIPNEENSEKEEKPSKNKGFFARLLRKK